MPTKRVFRNVLSAFLTPVFFVLVLGASASAACVSDELETQKNERLANLQSIEIEKVGNVDNPSLVRFAFVSNLMEVTSYSCLREEKSRHPGYVGYAWLFKIPDSFSGIAINIRNALSELDRSADENYQISGDMFYDLENKKETRIDSSVEFILDNKSYFDFMKSAKLMMSGSFWRETERGPEPLGLFKSDDLGLMQGYLDFNARHVLCFMGSAISLITPENVFDKIEMSGEPDLATAFNIAAESCDSAIQTGPAFVEPTVKGLPGKPGISGLSLSSYRRNIIFSATGPENDDPSYYIITTLSSISSFDAMAFVYGQGCSVLLR